MTSIGYSIIGLFGDDADERRQTVIYLAVALGGFSNVALTVFPVVASDGLDPIGVIPPALVAVPVAKPVAAIVTLKKVGIS